MARAARTLDLRARTAFHEAGHAVLSAAINDRPERVTIRGRDGTLGRSAQKMTVRPTSLARSTSPGSRPSTCCAVQRGHGLLSAVVAKCPVVEAAAAKRSATADARAPGGPDRRVAAFLRALRAEPKLRPVVTAYEKEGATPGRKFGKNGLKTKTGKLFALFTQGTLVVKLPNERAAALVEAGVGKPFDPGHGRLMKGWLTVTSPKASWNELTREAYDFVAGGR
jgi:hypothetical protein